MSQVSQNVLSSAIKLLKSMSMFGNDQMNAAGIVFMAALVLILILLQIGLG